jgi:uncharacterized protein
METEKRKPGRPKKIAAVATVKTDSSAIKKSDVSQSYAHNDNWANEMIGLGQIQDKSTKTHYSYSDILDNGTLTDMYIGGGLAARIVNIVADDMTREWVWIENEAARKPLEDTVRDLGMEEAYNTALRWQRLYGGSLLLIGVDDGQSMDRPLNENKIKSIKYFRPVDCTCVDLGASVWDMDPLSDRFGKVVLYKIRYTVYNTRVDMDVHYSRVIEFHNDAYPSGKFKFIDTDMWYWGMSSLQTVNESMRDLGGVTQASVNILYDFVSGVYKLKGLANMLAMDSDGTGKTQLTKRFEAINMSKSMLNAVILDAEGEDYTKQYTSVSDLPELIDRFMLQLSGSTGIPVTRLYGRSPAGLNATGDADIRNYYDIIEAQQRNRLYTPLMAAFRLICLWKKIDWNSVVVTFNSLYQLTETEKSQIEKDAATTKQAQVNTQITLINNNIRDVESVAKELGYGDEMPDNPVDTEQEETPLNSGDNPTNE